MKIRLVAAVTLLCSALASQAATPVFADNFDANAYGLNATPAGWSIGNNGKVDIIGVGGFDFIPGSGMFIDLDGSNGVAGLLERSFTLNAGTTYTAAFDLAGTHRGSSDSATVNFGTASSSYTLTSSAGWTPYSLTFTPTATASYKLSFLNAGGDNVGLLLDNVSITAVPEPQTWALMVGGLLAVGALARRRAAR